MRRTIPCCGRNVAGGAFYNPSTVQFPASYVGKYFYAELCSGWIRLMDPATNTATGFATGISNPVDVQVGADGSLYYLARGSGSVFRVQFIGPGGTPPSITTHPSNQTVAQGSPATFNVAANGSTPLNYQWQRNQVNIPGATATSYTLSSASFADNGATFRCVVSNAYGNVISNAATLTVNTPPSITGHPASQTVTQGQPATFTVTATGSAPLSYQWQRDQVNISGATSSSYTLGSASFADNGAKFRCVVTNSFGNATSNEATLTVNAPPNVTTHPSNQTVAQGSPATFSVVASGSTPLSYQWQRDQVNILGATSSSYTLASASFADNGAKFRCVVTNAFGNATSNEATLTVQPPPPVIETESNSDRAVALTSPAAVRDPFPLVDPFNLSSDSRTRVMFFVRELNFVPGDNLIARAEDSRMTVYLLFIEFVGGVPGSQLFTQIVVILPNNLPTGQDVLLSVTLNGQTSNKARIRIR